MSTKPVITEAAPAPTFDQLAKAIDDVLIAKALTPVITTENLAPKPAADGLDEAEQRVADYLRLMKERDAARRADDESARAADKASKEGMPADPHNDTFTPGRATGEAPSPIRSKR